MKLFVLILSSLIAVATADRYTPDWPSIDSRPLPSWYDQAKIGIFMHWGVFSVPSFGGEWFWWSWLGSRDPSYSRFMNQNYRPGFTYPDFATSFTAEFFDPNQWAKLLAASGARYLVITSKHHEGFTLWPSKYSWNWNSGDVGPKRDLIGDLATAVRNNTDVRFGVYHSWFEWFHPLYLQDKANNFTTQQFVKSKTMPELLELVKRYKPEVVWSDGDWEAPDTYWNSTEFLAWLYNDSPVGQSVVVNDRWGVNTSCKHGGYYSCQDRYNPGVLQPHKWENAMTLDKESWGYRREARLQDYLTIEELLQTLAETVSCNGNLLINIGPTSDGRIVPIFEERLLQLGRWLSVNGEAIYGSRPWRVQNDTVTSGVWYTQQPDAVFAVVLNWPKDSLLELGAVDGRVVSSINMLGFPRRLNWTTTERGTTRVQMPTLQPGQLQWAWTLKITGLNTV